MIEDKAPVGQTVWEGTVTLETSSVWPKQYSYFHIRHVPVHVFHTGVRVKSLINTVQQSGL